MTTIKCKYPDCNCHGGYQEDPGPEKCPMKSDLGSGLGVAFVNAWDNSQPKHTLCFNDHGETLV